MARKPTKRSKQNAELRKMMNTGPFQFSDIAETHYSLSVASASDLSGAVNDRTNPFRLNVTRFDETDEQDVRLQIDAEHARAIVMGKQTASQFGYGVYDVDLFVRPSTQAVNADNTEPSLGYAQAFWYHPTPLRMDALRALKGVEKLDDDHQGQEAHSLARSSAANPLLSTDIDVYANGALAENVTPVKGSNIIRFGYSASSSPVCRHSAFTVNLNPHTDSDVSDTWETQYYTLGGDSEKAFGIFDRMENAVNSPDASGTRSVETQWAYPISRYMVSAQSSAAAPMTWALAQADSVAGQDQGMDYLKAEFKGIHAVGGLILLTIPQWLSEGIDLNNDFDLVVSLKARKWVPLA